MPELTDDDHELLRFEATNPRHSGSKEQAARAAFDLSPARYYQRLNILIDRQDVLALYPALVHRLVRRRTQRATARAQRTFEPPVKDA